MTKTRSLSVTLLIMKFSFSTLPFSCLIIILLQYAQAVAELAEEVWDHYGFDFGTDYSGLFDALSHANYNVRVATAEALAAALDENPDTIQVGLLDFPCIRREFILFSLCCNVFRIHFLLYFLCIFEILELETWMNPAG